jgi:hypothetical protein
LHNNAYPRSDYKPCGSIPLNCVQLLKLDKLFRMVRDRIADTLPVGIVPQHFQNQLLFQGCCIRPIW